MWILRYYRYSALEEYEGDTKEEVLSFGRAIWKTRKEKGN